MGQPLVDDYYRTHLRASGSLSISSAVGCHCYMSLRWYRDALPRELRQDVRWPHLVRRPPDAPACCYHPRRDTGHDQRMC